MSMNKPTGFGFQKETKKTEQFENKEMRGLNNFFNKEDPEFTDTIKLINEIADLMVQASDELVGEYPEEMIVHYLKYREFLNYRNQTLSIFKAFQKEGVIDINSRYISTEIIKSLWKTHPEKYKEIDKLSYLNIKMAKFNRYFYHQIWSKMPENIETEDDFFKNPVITERILKYFKDFKIKYILKMKGINLGIFGKTPNLGEITMSLNIILEFCVNYSDTPQLVIENSNISKITGSPSPKLEYLDLDSTESIRVDNLTVLPTLQAVAGASIYIKSILDEMVQDPKSNPILHQAYINYYNNIQAGDNFLHSDNMDIPYDPESERVMLNSIINDTEKHLGDYKEQIRNTYSIQLIKSVLKTILKNRRQKEKEKIRNEYNSKNEATHLDDPELTKNPTIEEDAYQTITPNFEIGKVLEQTKVENVAEKEVKSDQDILDVIKNQSQHIKLNHNFEKQLIEIQKNSSLKNVLKSFTRFIEKFLKISQQPESETINCLEATLFNISYKSYRQELKRDILFNGIKMRAWQLRLSVNYRLTIRWDNENHKLILEAIEHHK